MACPSHLSCWGTGQFRNENLTCPVCSPVPFVPLSSFVGVTNLACPPFSHYANLALRELGLSPCTRMPSPCTRMPSPFTRMKLTCPPFRLSAFPFPFPSGLGPSPFHLDPLFIAASGVRSEAGPSPFIALSPSKLACPLSVSGPLSVSVPFRCPFYRLGGRQGLRCHQLVSLMRAIDSI
jgi:hypothetical protein